jgi:hypothetical protein
LSPRRAQRTGGLAPKVGAPGEGTTSEHGRPETELLEEARRGAGTICVQQRRRILGGHELLQAVADDEQSWHEPEYE